ncbi:RNA polymerase sigma factor [Pedobacter sp. UBA5917]|jgi:RNA polymerase sigma factor (sigma-70 family)|uniref:RNA polymerase sigma factor n=1 Tax=Pedobacter sp. UBA5917 TaxID=1947061 RepID=UPI0025FEBC4D|nr:sigma-70 family RNA polymerase sigma factor [Pedobacter sp. UBA5917]
MVERSDLDLWHLIKEGDSTVFEGIYGRYFDDLYEYGFRFCKDEFLVKDKIQDIFVKIWARRKQLGNTTNIKAYLFTALRNSLNEQHRNNSLHMVILDKFKKDIPVSFSLEFELLKKENDQQRLERLHQALSQLSDRQKEIIYLRFLQDIDYDEAAEIMGITTKAAYKLSARAIDSLKKLVSASDKELYLLLFLLQTSKLLR